MRAFGSIASSLVACVACAGEAPKLERATAPAVAPAQAARISISAGADAAAPSASSSQPSEPRIPFPPPDAPPPHERSAMPGDGKWQRLGVATAHDRAGEGEPVMVRTAIHPHPVSHWVTDTIVAINLQRTRAHLVCGTEEPKSKDAPAELRTGLVPQAHQDELLAVFNGGWKTVHGYWGVMAGGHTFVPPRREGCTIALMKDGSVRIEPWPKLEANVAEMEAYRQTPPCLIEDGDLHRALAANQEHLWGGMDPNVKTRQRSALGVDASGRILFYAYGEEAGARQLADGLRAVGAVGAAELDINFIWVRFLLFGKPSEDAKLQVTSTLIPKMAHEKGVYTQRAWQRDFFYVRRL